MTLEEIDKIKINFIVGAGRSGTTLLVVLLNQYKNCIASPEIHHFIYFYKKYKNITHVTEQVKEDYRNYIKLFFRYKRNLLIGPATNELIDALENGQQINYRQLTKLIYLGLYGTKGTSGAINVIVDKNPYYTFHIDKILTVFPEANLLALVRDYRAYTLSNIQSRKTSVSKKTPVYYAHVWNLFNNSIIEGIKKHPNNIKVVKYEEIALNKEAAVQTIVEFFGLTYDEIIFDFYHDVKKKIDLLDPSDKNYARHLKKVTDLSSPINAERVHAWKVKLPKADIEKADAFCGETGRYFGYETMTEVSWLKKLSFYTSSVPNLMRIVAFKILKSPDLHLYYRYNVINKK